VFPPDVADPEIENAVVGVAAVSEVAEPLVAFVAVVVAEVVFAFDLEVSELGVVFVSEPQASVDIAVAFVVLVPVSVVVVEVDSSGRPKFLAFPNVDYFASPSSSFEVVG
jgi:hypothetical protein